MSSHNDSFVASGSSPTSPDVIVESHFSILLFRLLSPSAKSWVDENVQEDAQFFGGALVVEEADGGGLMQLPRSVKQSAFGRFLAFVDAVSLELYSTHYHELTDDQRKEVKAQVLFLHFGEPSEVPN